MKQSPALQTALFELLRADDTLTAARGGPRIFDAPPHAQSGEASPPYITLGDETVTAWDTKTEEGAAHELTLTIWSAKPRFGGMEVSDARKLKALEDENAKLKKLLAEQMLDNAMLKDVNSKKW